MKNWLIFLLLLTTGFSAGCDQEKMLNMGFTLPKGDASLGQSVFIEKRCIDCHTLVGEEFAGPEWQVSQTRAINVKIGGNVTKLKTYGDLVTSIINPSHKIAEGYAVDEVTTSDGESKMRNYNDVMTVTELVNIVAFLQPQYQLTSPPVSTYHYYVNR